MSKSGIYKIYFLNNPDSFYIGSAINLTKRKARHRYQLKKQIHKNLYLQRTYNKYGREDFVFEIIDLCTEAELINREQKHIILLKPKLNILQIAGSCLGYKHSEDAKNKISKANLGRKMTPEQILLGVIARKGQRTSKGCKRTEVCKKHLSEIKKKPIINNKTNKVLNSIQALSDLINMKYQTIYAQITGRNKNIIDWRIL